MSETVRVLGVDVGTTRCKAGLYDLSGTAIRLAARPTPVRRDGESNPYFDPEELWMAVAECMREAAGNEVVSVVGVAGMAEAGLLVDGATGQPRTEIIPWYDPRSTPQADLLASREPQAASYRRTGLYSSYKYGVPKILWLIERDPSAADGAVWLSVPDYIVFRLTGACRTDPTLAARTYAYDILERRWDRAWIRDLGLPGTLFPPVLASGEPAGESTLEAASMSGLLPGTPVAVSGHDHVCTMLGVGVTGPGLVLDSMGTAESLMGVVLKPEDRAFHSGLTLAPHVLPALYCWLGGISASGGSVEWLRAQLAESPLDYDEVARLAVEAGDEPTGIVYFPYLSGAGAPCHDLRARAAFVGLDAQHGRGDLVRAVLEGTAYEALSIHKAAERLTGAAAGDVMVVGGGVRNDSWIQIKADVSGVAHRVLDVEEAAVRGAAFTAAVGSCLVPVEELPPVREVKTVYPDPSRHDAYRTIYENRYLPLQGPLRRASERGAEQAGMPSHA